MTQATKDNSDKQIEAMFKAGAHFGFSRSRRHPSAASFIFGAKNRVEIFDLTKTVKSLEAAKEFVRKLGAESKQIVFVSSKAEAKSAVKDAALSLNMPYVAGRWVGGTITNFPEIKSRIDKLLDLQSKRQKGELVKYTKKERLMIDREIEKLESLFSGLASLKEMPKVLFVIDGKQEKIAVTEAGKAGIPVVALCGSDCDLKDATYAIPGNDSSKTSVKFFVDEIVSAYQEGKTAGAKIKA